ncbi:MAG: glycosyltransferase [Armatimonadota bacterium]
MNIGMFADCYIPAVNGVTSSIRSLKNELENQGHNVYLFVPSYSGYTIDTEKNTFRFKSIPYPFQKEHRISFPFPRKYINMIPSLNLDVVHLHTPFPVGIMGMKNAKKYNLPCVFTHHTLWEKYTHYLPLLPEKMRVKLAVSLCVNFANKCRMVIAPSTGVKKLFACQGVKTKIEVVPSGINFDKFSKGSAGSFLNLYPQLKNKKILSYCGRLGREKNLYFLLRVFKAVSAGYSDAHLLFIGDGPQRNNLMDYVKELGLINKVTFSGYLAPEKVADALSASYLFVFASTTETQGLVIQEAQAAGCPAVAVKATGVEDAVTDAEDGYLTCLDEEEMALRCLRVLEMPKLRDALSINGKIKAEKYSIENTTKKVLGVYNQAIALSNS